MNEESGPGLWTLLNLLEEQRLRDLELSGIGGYAGSTNQTLMPDRMIPLERFARQPVAEPGVSLQGGVNSRGSRSANVYGGSGALELAFPMLGGTAGVRAEGNAAYVEPQQGRARMLYIPQGLQGYYETPSGSRYSLEYTQTPNELNPAEYARELMLRYSRRF
jgi:hypothetical protein